MTVQEQYGAILRFVLFFSFVVFLCLKNWPPLTWAGLHLALKIFSVATPKTAVLNLLASRY